MFFIDVRRHRIIVEPHSRTISAYYKCTASTQKNQMESHAHSAKLAAERMNVWWCKYRLATYV